MFLLCLPSGCGHPLGSLVSFVTIDRQRRFTFGEFFILGGSLPFSIGIVVSLRPLSAGLGSLWLVTVPFPSLSLYLPVPIFSWLLLLLHRVPWVCCLALPMVVRTLTVGPEVSYASCLPFALHRALGLLVPVASLLHWGSLPSRWGHPCGVEDSLSSIGTKV